MSTVAEAIVNLLKKEAASYVIKALVARLPFLGTWFMNPIIGFLVTEVIDILYDKGALGINWLWIIIENNIELNAAIKSRIALKEILKAGGNYEEAEENFDEATDDIIRRRHKRLPR